MVSTFMRRAGAARAGVICGASLALGLSCLFAQDAQAFPLWPKSKGPTKDQDKGPAKVQDKGSAKDQGKGQDKKPDKNQDKSQDENQGDLLDPDSDKTQGQDLSQPNHQSRDHGKARLPRRIDDQGIPSGANTDAASTAAATAAVIDEQINKLEGGQSGVPVDFVPSANANINAAGGNDGGKVTASQDPMAIYRKCGVSPVEERKIRALAQEFEGMQRVRMKLLMNLLADLRQYELQTDPDPKAVMAKQEEINKVTDQMVVERMKLLLSIRDVMTFDEKQRLVETLQREKR